MPPLEPGTQTPDQSPGSAAPRGWSRAAWIGVLTVCGAAVIVGASSLAYRVSHGESDFIGVIRGVAEARQAGRFGAAHASPYPPSAYALWHVFTLLPDLVAAGVWSVLATLMYVVTGWWLARYAVGLQPQDRAPVFFVAFALTAPWIASDLAQGNTSSLVAFSAAGSWVLAARNRPWLAGLVLGLGLVMKPLPLVILFYFVYKRMWRVVATTVVCVAALVSLPAMLLYGPAEALRGWQLWHQAIGQNASPLNTVWLNVPEINYHNSSAVAAVMRVFGDVRAHESGYRVTLVQLPRWGVAAIWYALSAVVVLPVLWVTRRPAARLSRERQAEELALYVVLMLFFSPELLSYYLSITLVPVTVLIGRAVRVAQREGRREWATAGLVAGYAASGLHMASRFLRAVGGSGLALLILWFALLRGLARSDEADCTPPPIG
jgi:hypothetical protein